MRPFYKRLFIGSFGLDFELLKASIAHFVFKLWGAFFFICMVLSGCWASLLGLELSKTWQSG